MKSVLWKIQFLVAFSEQCIFFDHSFNQYNGMIIAVAQRSEAAVDYIFFVILCFGQHKSIICLILPTIQGRINIGNSVSPPVIVSEYKEVFKPFTGRVIFWKISIFLLFR